MLKTLIFFQVKCIHVVRINEQWNISDFCQWLGDEIASFANEFPVAMLPSFGEEI